MPAPRKPSDNGRVPLVSLGQGDYRRDYYPEDFDGGRQRRTVARSEPSPRRLETELVAAALRYVAFADWFENRPITQAEKARDPVAMAAFNRVESELRLAGARLLERLGHRELVLERTLAECGIVVEAAR